MPNRTPAEAAGTARQGASHAALEAFVRDTLGCGCPAAVLARIDVVPPVAGEPSEVTLTLEVGGRLLVWLLECGGAADLESRLPEVARAARAERDHRGFNRVRLVWATANPGAVAEELQEVLARVGDERVHLHVLEPGDVASLFRRRG